jgi:hypothetical protein
MTGAKIIDGLKEAMAGDIARVTIDGETWAKVRDIHADQQEIMRINNELRAGMLRQIALIDAWSNNPQPGNHADTILAVGQIARDLVDPTP